MQVSLCRVWGRIQKSKSFAHQGSLGWSIITRIGLQTAAEPDRRKKETFKALCSSNNTNIPRQNCVLGVARNFRWGKPAKQAVYLLSLRDTRGATVSAKREGLARARASMIMKGNLTANPIGFPWRMISSQSISGR